MSQADNGSGGGSGAIEDVDGDGDAGFELVSQRLGALPLVNHFLDRARVPALLGRYLPACDARYHVCARNAAHTG